MMSNNNPFNLPAISNVWVQPDEKAHFQAMFIACLAVNAKKIVELGSGSGDGCRVFNTVAKLTDGHVWSIDIDANPLAKTIHKAEDRISWVNMDSVTAASLWDKGDIDVLYADTDHSYDRTVNEMVAWLKYHPKIIFCHDTLGFNGEVYRGMVDFCKRSGKTLFNFNYVYGWAMIV